MAFMLKSTEFSNNSAMAWHGSGSLSYQSADPGDDVWPPDEGHGILRAPGLAPSEGTPETPSGVHAGERNPLEHLLGRATRLYPPQLK